MTDEAKKLRAEYKRNWQRKNRDKVADYQRKYWENKAAATANTEPGTDKPKGA